MPKQPLRKAPLQPQGSKKQDSVFKEAWDNMSADFDRLLPEKLRRQDKKKFVLWLFLLEVVVLGLLGTALWRWWAG